MCNSLYSNQPIQIKRWVIAGQVNENTNNVRQNFPDQAVLKMPKIVRSDAARQLRADSFAPLPYASAKSDKMFRKY